MSTLARRWAAPFLALVALALVPWAFLLAQGLPSRHLSRHWDLAWVGFDLLLAAALLVTAVAAMRRSSYLQGAASASGALLVVDAWFDILTSSSGDELTLALGFGLLGELPLAGLCFWLALDTERFYRAADRLRGGD